MCPLLPECPLPANAALSPSAGPACFQTGGGAEPSWPGHLAWSALVVPSGRDRTSGPGRGVRAGVKLAVASGTTGQVEPWHCLPSPDPSWR